MSARQQQEHDKEEAEVKAARNRNIAPDWSMQCDICGESPCVPATGLCGPCTFGEADTIGGNW